MSSLNARKKIVKGAVAQNSGRFLVYIPFLVFFIGCTTYNAATGRNEFIAISTPAEVSMGRDIHNSLKQEYKFSTSKVDLQRIQRIGEKVAQISDRQDYVYHFYLVEKDELNAFTVPGGNIYFFRGLMKKLKTDDQIASVLAHEIGHCAARHTVKKFQAALGYQLVGSLIFSALELQEQSRKIASLGTDTLMNLVFSAYSRRDELEADRLAVKYMYLAGYDLKGMIETFQVLDQASQGPDVPIILRSHPFIKDRIEAAKKEIEAVRFKYGEAP